GNTGMDAPPVVGLDVKQLGAGMTAVIDEKAAAFPIADLAHLPPGDYAVQAVLDTNRDLKSAASPGHLYSTVKRMHLDPGASGAVKIELTRQVPPEELPSETDYVKYVKVESARLTAFHGRPIFLRGGIILPRDFEKDPIARYPLRVEIGGYGTR